MASTAPKVAAAEHRESAEVTDEKAEALAKAIRKSKHFIVLTGAGVSTSAGIPDFRGPDGAWTLMAQGRERTREAVSTLQAVPSLSHMALVELQNQGLMKYLISQNCDGLHRRSGISADKISEIHGNSNRESCKSCGKEYMRDFRAVSEYETSVHDHRTGRKCGRCGGPLHDTIINFGELLPVQEMELAHSNSNKADLCLVLGSSLTVSPANCFPEAIGRRKGASLAICNLQATDVDDQCEIRVFAEVDVFMASVMDKLGLSIPPFILHRHVALRVVSDGNRYEVHVEGLDRDRTPVSFLRSIRLKGTRRVAHAEPFAIRVRGGMEDGTELKLELEFMGHYGEPKLDVPFVYRGLADETRHYHLGYDPRTGGWVVNEEA